MLTIYTMNNYNILCRFTIFRLLEHTFLLFSSEWDGDGDGCVDFKEFLHVVSKMLTEDVTANFERMKEAFRMFDKVTTII